MALNIQDQSYSGKFASAYWLPSFFGMDTLKKGVVNVVDGIKKSYTIGSIDFVGGLQPRQAEPTTPHGAWTVDKKTLTPEDAMIYTTFNPRDLEVHWESENLSKLLLERNLPATFEAYCMHSATSRVFEQMESAWWMSSKDFQALTDTTDPRFPNKFFDGIIKQLVGDSSVLFNNSPAVITKSNVLTFMDGLISLLTVNCKGIMSNPSKFKRVKFLMSPLTEFIYAQALTDPTFKGINFSEGGVPPYKGFNTVSLAGFPDNTIILCEAIPSQDGSFHIGLNSKDDENTIEMRKTANANETYYIKALMKMDVTYKYGKEIAMTTTLTEADFTL